MRDGGNVQEYESLVRRVPAGITERRTIFQTRCHSRCLEVNRCPTLSFIVYIEERIELPNVIARKISELNS